MHKGYKKFTLIDNPQNVEGWDLLDIIDVQVSDDGRVLNTKRFLFGQKGKATADELEDAKKELKKLKNAHAEKSLRLETTKTDLFLAEKHFGETKAEFSRLTDDHQKVWGHYTDLQRLHADLETEHERSMRRTREVFGTKAVDDALDETPKES